MPPSGHGGFVDEVTVSVRAGHGGRGAVSFRREPYVPRGGPDGGDGGRGGSVILEAAADVSSLAGLAHAGELRAEDGRPGSGGRRTGRDGRDLVLRVPVGTVVRDQEGAVLADLAAPGERALVARGGAGGRGNARFASPVRRAPDFAEPGLSGQQRRLRLELRLIADVGLVGAPNAGKSSLLRAISAATPRVADYPFTTLEPELGVVELEQGRLVVADVPGLVEGAAQGAGLGLRFLRHLERTRVLLFLVDGAAPDPWAQLEMVRREVTAYSAELGSRPSLVAINKLDLPRVRELSRASPPGVLWCSALTGEGVPELLEAVLVEVAAAPAPPRATPAPPVRRLHRQTPTRVERRPWGFEITGAAVERLVARSRFDSPGSLQRFQVALDRAGISAALAEAGAREGDTVRIAGREFEYRP